MRNAVFAGTFDPVTVGHEAVIKKASEAFDKLTVAICINPDKTTLYPLDMRLQALRAVCSDYKNVEVVYFEGMLVDLMRQKGAIYNVRGLRNSKDFEYENAMHEYNLKLYPELVTIYLPCSSELNSVSSTLVRKKAELGEDLSGLVPKKALSVILSKNKG